MQIAADTGGTFTDLAVYSPEHGLRIVKALTDYDAPMRGVMANVDAAHIAMPDVDAFKFGTTLVINTFIQRTGARTAMICTRGFRDSLEIRRGNRLYPFDFRYTRDPVLVPRESRFEVGERMAADGGVVRPVDPEEVAEIAEQLRSDGVEAVAISLLNAYANDAHERQIAALLEAHLPHIFVTTGTALSREWYEYERGSTAAANAYVGPVLADFVDDMAAVLDRAGLEGPRYLMGSNGGVLSLDEARRRPVQLVESGPVGGCIGAAEYARLLGIEKLIAFDMGGTTAKCALVQDGRFDVRNPYYVGGVEHGFPMRGSVIDIIEVGAGGGSIASLDAQGRLSVGPRSAGSTPGPVCYGRGGTEPTITDANVLLGRIGVHSFMAGNMALDLPAAEQALREKVGEPMGYPAEALDRVAQGILDLGLLTMSSAISRMTTERGIDPRHFALFVFGGGGPLHGVELARLLGIGTVIVPRFPGAFSAVGMLMADARIDEIRTFLHPLEDRAIMLMRQAFEEMRLAAMTRLPRRVGIGNASTCACFAEMRFKGQRHALRVELDDASDAGDVRLRFLASYRERYGHGATDASLEFVALGVTLTEQLGRLTPDCGNVAPPDERPAETREVYFAGPGCRVPTPVLQRDGLAVGQVLEGPLIIEEYGSSTVLGPGDRLEVGSLGELKIEVRA